MNGTLFAFTSPTTMGGNRAFQSARDEKKHRGSRGSTDAHVVHGRARIHRHSALVFLFPGLRLELEDSALPGFNCVHERRGPDREELRISTGRHAATVLSAIKCPRVSSDLETDAVRATFDDLGIHTPNAAGSREVVA